MGRIVDLSQVIEDNMPVYPGDIRTNLFQSRYLGVNGYNDHRLDISMHAGTHVDSPMHMTESGTYICEAPLEPFIGPGCVLDVRDRSVITLEPEHRQLVKDKGTVLLYTGWDKFYGEEKYYSGHPVLDEAFCEFLLQKNVRMVGVDMPSPDLYPFPVHKILFENGIFIIENLTNLDKLLGADFEVTALPLRIKADSSMARVVARIYE